MFLKGQKVFCSSSLLLILLFYLIIIFNLLGKKNTKPWKCPHFSTPIQLFLLYKVFFFITVKLLV